MKTRVTAAFVACLIWAGFFALPIYTTSCTTPPSARVVQYQTLKASGEAAKASMQAATQLLKHGSITVEQWQKVATFYDTRFQPSWNMAAAAAQSNLSTLTSPDVANLLNQFIALVAELTTKPAQ